MGVATPAESAYITALPVQGQHVCIHTYSSLGSFTLATDNTNIFVYDHGIAAVIKALRWDLNDRVSAL